MSDCSASGRSERIIQLCRCVILSLSSCSWLALPYSANITANWPVTYAKKKAPKVMPAEATQRSAVVRAAMSPYPTLVYVAIEK